MWPVKTSRPPSITWRKTATWAARSSNQKGTEERSRSQADAADGEGDEVEDDDGAANYEVNDYHGLFPPKRVGIRLADAEKHYVAMCYKVGI